MKPLVVSASAVALLAVTAYAKCPPDSVLVGALCVDKYEASVWEIPATNPTTTKSNAGLIKKVQKGTAVQTNLTGGGATQISPSSSCTPSFPANFPANGQWTPAAGLTPPSPGVFAVSILGVHPTACITWFQAEQACTASGKRLLTNQEWQRAAAGTMEGVVGDNGTTDCNTDSVHDAVNTGSRANCKSNYGAFDMVGNVDEWVADWVPRSTACGSWSIGSSDLQCLAGADTSGEPGALIRGGQLYDGVAAGPFAVSGINSPSLSQSLVGFRCAR
ncbi:MAG: SUMF1/EgtB/PvdO family nonheme iron enzyme [Candidatus Binatia bacterium]